MKLILTGATGFVGAECLRLALQNPKVTEVVALARREVEVPQGTSAADKAKFTTIILEDMGQNYPSSVKEKLRGADACIWNLAITPNKTSGMTSEEVKRICHDYTITGLEAMAEVANPDHPFRFIYTSGAFVERDQEKSLWLMSEHRKMRGEVENAICELASKSNGKVEVQSTRPGLIYSDADGQVLKRNVLGWTIGLPNLHVSELAAAEIDQALNGFQKDILLNDKAASLGREVLKGYQSK